jgi:hypothetical protein
MGVDYKASVVVGVLLTDEQAALVRDEPDFARMIECEVHQCGDFIGDCGVQYVVGVQLKRTAVDDIGYKPIGGDLDLYSHGVVASRYIDTFNAQFGDKVRLDPAQIRMYIGLEVG